ncbi:hypothetical protein ABMA27_010388 [Loxostege sticticalis]|uniref:MADF domain-containing protein n=1 Tax=Loxostege sticticalis TaxID=481309 RepID=A0ABR3H5J6_LOXSC
MAASQKRKFVKPTLETRDLIRLVHERRCLWDRNFPDYRDRSLKEKAWVEIYKVIEPDYDEFNEEIRNLIGSQITRKWYNVRDSYVKSKKHNIRNKPYIYAKHLSFLDAIHFDDSECDESRNADRNYDAIEEHWLNDVLVVDDENTSEPEAKRPKEIHVEKTHEDDNSIVSVLANLINREEDDDRAFFKSIIPMVKSLSDESRFEFRIQVMNLLKTLKSKETKRSCVKIEFSKDNSDSDD